MDSKTTRKSQQLRLDQITRELFAQLRGDENQDLCTLTCPKCSDRLEAMPLKFVRDEKKDTEYQIVWWTCRGLKKKTCIFPLNMPTDVFWTKRTMEQMRQGLLPPPNIHLLPKHLHYLYPSVFTAEKTVKEVHRISKISTFTRKNTVASKKPCPNNDSIDLEHFTDTPPVFTTPQTLPKFSPINIHKTEHFNFCNKEDPYSINSQQTQQQLKYGDSESRRNVDLFADTNSALNSHLSLRFSTDSFLSKINSEMSQKKLIQPPLAIGQKQRLRFANFVDKYRGMVQPSSLDKSLPRREKLPKKRRKNTDDTSSIASALKHFNEATRARNLSVRLGIKVTEPDPQFLLLSQFPPSSSSENYLQSMPKIQESVMQERASSVGYTSPCSSKNNDFTDSNRAESRTSVSTDNSSTQATRRPKKAFKNALPFGSMGDPELDKLVKLKFKEVMASEKFSKTKKKKAKQADSEQSSQLQELMPVTAEELAAREALHVDAGYTPSLQFFDPQDSSLLDGFEDFDQCLSYGLDQF